MKPNPNNWFPAFSPTGKIASGAGEIFAEGVSYGQGWGPRWIDDDRFVFNPGVTQDTHGVVDTRTGVISFRTSPGNEVAAGGGKYALWLPSAENGASRTMLHDDNGLNLLSRGDARPHISREGDITYCTNYQDMNHTVMFNGQPISGLGVNVDPVTQAGHVVWSEYTGVNAHARVTRGWCGRGVEDLRVLDMHESEFASIPIQTPTGVFVLTGTHFGFFIRRWGWIQGWIHFGECFNPDAICIGNTIYVVGSTASGKPLLFEFPLNAQTVNIYAASRPVTPPAPEPPKPPEQPKVSSMELPRSIYETYAAVARKFSSLHSSENDDDRREANKRGVQTIRARHKGTGELDGSRYVCKSEHNTGWSAASKDAPGYVAPEFGEPVHGAKMKMHMFDMISGGNRQVNAWPIRSHNFNDNPPNEDAYVLIPEPKDWLEGNGELPGTVHRYNGGGNDTNECDVCGKSRFDPVHFVPEGKQLHDYDGGEHDSGLCDICQKDRNDAIHQSSKPEEPEVEKHEFVGSATARFCSECGEARSADIHNMKQPEPAPGGGTIDLTPVLAKMDQIITGQAAIIASINTLRTDVVKAVRESLANLPSIFRLPINRTTRKGKR